MASVSSLQHHLAPSVPVLPRLRARARRGDREGPLQRGAIYGKLPAKRGGKKVWGVRAGWQPGIYYSGQEADEQTQEYPGREKQAFDTAEEAEKDMYHTPDQCEHDTCTESCQERRRLEPLKQQIDADTPVVCDGCNNKVAGGQVLCKDCLGSGSRAYEELFMQRHTLDSEQVEVFKNALQGNNVMVTGSGGAGKSKLIKAIAEYFKNIGLIVGIIAPEGMPATSIGGRTLHSVMQSYVGYDREVNAIPIEELLARAHDRKDGSRLPLADVVIVDEVSMIDRSEITRLSMTLSAAAHGVHDARAFQPFGGAQLILSADFFQLQAIRPLGNCFDCGLKMKRNNVHKWVECSTHGRSSTVQSFTFKSRIWDNCRFECHELKGNHRQRDETARRALEVLRREGQLTDGALDYIICHTLKPGKAHIHAATTLYLMGIEARKHNDDVLAQLPGQSIRYQALDTFLWRNERHPALAHHQTRKRGGFTAFRNHEFSVDLDLKDEMLVLLTTTIDETDGLVSGSLGQIMGWIQVEDDEMPRAEGTATNGRSLGSSQILRGPHRSYQDDQIQRFFDTQKHGGRSIPIVQFENGAKRAIFPVCVVQELGNDRPFSLISRTQFPLSQGSAISVYRSQGLTLDKVVVDLSRFKKSNLAYVALSRTRNLSDIILTSETNPEFEGNSGEVHEYYERDFAYRPRSSESGKEGEADGEESVADPDRMDIDEEGGGHVFEGSAGGGRGGKAAQGAGEQMAGLLKSLSIKPKPGV